MNEPTISPGRCTIREFNAVDGYFALVSDRSGRLLAKVFSPADAHLIAAAAEMREALALILSPSPHYAATKEHRERVAEARAKGRAALAAARGEA